MTRGTAEDSDDEEGQVDEVKRLIAGEIPRLRRFALTLVDAPEEADDLVQDCLERAIRKRHLWRRQGSIRSWMYRILYNIFVNQGVRRRLRRRQVPIGEATTDADARLSAPPRQEHHVACRDIGEAMKALPREQHAAIMLVAVEGLSYDEAAAVMDVPVGTVRSRLSRGRERLGVLYAGHDADPMLRRVK